MTNWKTTLAGVISAIGLGGFATTLQTREGQIAILVAAIGALAKGWAAKDSAPGKPFAPQVEKAPQVTPFLDQFPKP